MLRERGVAGSQPMSTADWPLRYWVSSVTERINIRGPRSSSFLVPRNLSNHMDRQAHTGDTVIVKSRVMTGWSQTLHAVFFILNIFPSSMLLHSCLTAYFRSSFLPKQYPCLFCLLLSFLNYFTIIFCHLSILKISLSPPRNPILYFISLFFLHLFSS
jgi:hypothetical protein